MEQTKKSYKIRHHEESIGLISFVSEIHESDNPVQQYLNPETKQKAIEIKASNYKNINKKELSIRLAKAELEFLCLFQFFKAEQKRSFYLEQLVKNYQEKEVLNDQKRQLNKNNLFEKDNSRLKECLLEVLSELKSEPEPNTFITFKNRVFKKYPFPEHIPKARLTSEEKLQPLENQKKDIQSKERQSWNDSRLRTFFKINTGIKPSSKK